jgi:DNA-binding CsgD family transcriptional regulator
VWWTEQQLQTLDDAMSDARKGRPSGLVVTGEPGQGKSTLLWELADRAGDFDVRLVQGMQDRRDQKYAGLRQLIPAGAEVASNPFQAAQRLRDSIEPDGTRPALIIVDDAQWVDAETLEALGWLVRRAAGDRLLVAAASRPLPTARNVLQPLLDLPESRSLRLSGLDAEQTLAMARTLDPAVSDTLGARLFAHTGGNPLYVRGILSEHTAAQLDTLEELPAPAQLAESLTRRAREISPDAAALLTAISILGDTWSPLSVASDLAAIQNATTAAQLLVDAGLIELRRNDTGAETRIYHAVVRAAIHDGIPADERQRLHLRAAALVTDRGQALVHRLLASPGYDDELAEDLAAFGWELHLVHRNREAARFLRRASRVSSEPATRERRWLDAPFEATLARDVDAVEEELSPVSWAQDHVRASLVQGFVLIVRKQWLQARDLLDDIDDRDLSAADDVTRYRTLVLQGWSRLVTGADDIRTLHALDSANSLGADPGFTGYLTFAYAMAHGTSAGEDPSGPASARRQLYAGAWHGMANALTGEADNAVRDLEAFTARIDSGQVDMGDGVFHALLGLSLWLRGDWRRASIAFDLAQAARFGANHPMVQALLPLTALTAGDSAQAAELTMASRQALRAAPWPQAIAAATIADTLALALTGDDDDRRRYRSTVFADFGSTNLPGAVAPLWLLHAGFAASWADDVPAVEELSDRLEAAPQEWTAAGALWLRGLAAIQRGDPVEAGTLLRDAHASWSPSLRIHRALLAADIATVTRSSNPADAAVYRAEHENILRLAGGAALLADHVDPLAVLTDREKDVVTLMAEGLSYAQIAKELYLSRSTVAFHLSNAYAKTGTSSRHELVQLLRSTSTG